MFDFEIIEVNNPIWNEYINGCVNYDFYHTACYHKIEQKQNEKSILIVVRSFDEYICLPLIVSPIPSTNYFDANSVYGYGGPIASKDFSKLSERIITFFKKCFLNYCRENKIISVFSRLHPYINNFEFFNGFGVVRNLNKVVGINLKADPTIQRRQYGKSTKNQINQLKKKKRYEVKVIRNNDNFIENFVEIYHETMDRVKAAKSYYFDFEYFHNFLNNECFNSVLLMGFKEGEPAVGGIFTYTNTIMQYHLSGTKNIFMRDHPMKLIINEARLLGNDLNLNYLNLGGGVGGSDEDSLFRFKSGFSKDFHQFKVWNLIVNEEVYNSLVAEKNLKPEDYPNFFPLYRAK
ncbi:GNAT family N-acetyltransferase [uncultured Mesonia sp.]|uniref:GNAT family N-acetyltransferase n=1 Tax=uncultured Mesonia sp. TaxID=399731 RepID=UPI00374FB704